MEGKINSAQNIPAEGSSSVPTVMGREIAEIKDKIIQTVARLNNPAVTGEVSTSMEQLNARQKKEMQNVIDGKTENAENAELNTLNRLKSLYSEIVETHPEIKAGAPKSEMFAEPTTQPGGTVYEGAFAVSQNTIGLGVGVHTPTIDSPIVTTTVTSNKATEKISETTTGM
jgi:hypothetical protein